ncbi:MAG: class I SAM-dependent methyltransferase [SAR324 cluster bacterium]|nr:class I SAM-dependent methyltransferase [SAR324 cluster bacterium]
MADNPEFKYFSNKDLDRINENYMKPVFDEIISKYDSHLNHVLDYGCGNGVFGSYFKEHTSCSLTGIDASTYALEQAIKSGYDQVIQLGDFCSQNVPLHDNSIDFVLCKDVLEHLLDPLFVLNEIHRVLKINGLLLLHIPNHFPWVYRLKFLFTNDLDTQKYFPDATDWDFPHIRFFRLASLVNKLEERGFKILENYSDFFTLYLPKTGRIPGLTHLQKYLAAKTPDHFAAGFTLLCQKSC